MVDNFDSPVKHYDQVEEAVVIYRETLAKAEVSRVGWMDFLECL